MQRRVALTRILRTAWIALLVAGTAAGQRGRALDPQDLDRLREVLDREDMHPEGGSELVGIEEGDNGFRERTPALLKAEQNRRQVSEDDLYNRRLALFEGRIFAAPLPAGSGEEKRPASKDRRELVDEAFGDARSRTIPIAVGTLLVLLLAFRVLR